MNEDQIYHLLELFLNQTSQTYRFAYAIVDMRRMFRLLYYDRSKLGAILSLPELERFEKFTMPKKKLQWLAGRYAIKKALLVNKFTKERFFALNRIDVLSLENSAPYLVQFPKLQVTITHSHPYCIGAVSEHPIGVDLEKVMTLRDSLINQYFHPNEIHNLAAKSGKNDYHSQAIIYWTRKEAVSKLLKLGLKMDFKQIDTANDSVICSENGSSLIQLESCNLTDYCFSLAIEGEPNKP